MVDFDLDVHVVQPVLGRGLWGGGETITYEVSPGRAFLRLTRDGDGFLLTTAAPNLFPPERLGPSLFATSLFRKYARVDAHGLGMLWLPPSQRQVGAETVVGEVAQERQQHGRPALLVEELNRKGRRFYDRNTGFLLYMQNTSVVGFNGASIATLKSSTIQGLQPPGGALAAVGWGVGVRRAPGPVADD